MSGTVASVRRQAEQLPGSLAPRGLCRPEAAAYIGISPNMFDELVKDGRMPQPKCIGRRRVTDQAERITDLEAELAGVSAAQEEANG